MSIAEFDESLAEAEAANLSEMPDKKQSVDERFDEAFSRIRSLEGKPSIAIGSPIPQPSSDNWFKRNSYWFPWLVTLIVGSGAVFSCFHWFFGDLVDHRIDSRIEQPTKDINQIKIDIAKIGTKMDILQDFLKPQIQKKLKDVAINPLNKENQEVASTLINHARDGSIPAVPAPLVEQAGTNFVKAASSDPRAWPVALDFLNYRSILNADYVPEPVRSAGGGIAISHYEILKVPGKDVPRISAVMMGAPAKEAAHLGSPGYEKPEDTKIRPAWIIAVGGALRIDGQEIRDVIFEGVEVHYSGEAVSIENSIFDECTFVFSNTKSSRMLAERILASPMVSFNNQ